MQFGMLMRSFLLLDEEYRIKATFKRGRIIRDPAVELARLLRKASRGSSFKGGRGRSVDFRQRCTAKMQYSSSIEAHKVQLEKYLIMEGKGIDGEAPNLFGTELETYRENMTGKNFRIFLSPESSQIDIKDLAEKFMVKLERQTGYRLYWQGACHYDTAHPHAHLLINGVDKTGREVYIPKDIVKTFMRDTAQDICTTQIGSRTIEDIKRQKEQELLAPRYTKLDDHIQKFCYGTNRILPIGILHDKERILARMETLRKLNLCTYENGGYTFKPNWHEDLKTNGRYNAFLKARESLLHTDKSQMKLYTGELGKISGKVTQIYRTDGDASDNHAVVIESLEGKAYFVPLLKKPELYTGDEGKAFKDGEIVSFKQKINLQEGELVTMSTYQTQRGRLTPIFFRQGSSRTQTASQLGNLSEGRYGYK